MTDKQRWRWLAAYRLEYDLSYERLAEQMKLFGYPVRARSLHLILNDRLRRAPTARTAYKIAQFVTKAQRQVPKVRRSQKRKRAA